MRPGYGNDRQVTEAVDFLRLATPLGLLSLVLLLPSRLLLLLGYVAYGGAFFGDLFDSFGRKIAFLASYVGLVLSIVLSLGILAAQGLVLASVIWAARRLWLRSSATWARSRS